MYKKPTNLVKSSIKAKEYYVFSIKGTEYIRPISMKYHDRFKIKNDEEQKISDIIQEYGKSAELFFEDLELFERNPTQYKDSSTSDMLHRSLDLYNSFLIERFDNDFEASDFNKAYKVYNENTGIILKTSLYSRFFGTFCR